MNIEDSEMFTGTTIEPMDKGQEGVFEFISDIWNVKGDCGSHAQENSTCRYSITNVKVKGGILKNAECSKIMAQDDESWDSEL